MACAAELEEERNTTKALKSEKISGEAYSCVMICIRHCHLTRPLGDKHKKWKVGKVHTALANGNHPYLTVVEDVIGLPIAAGSQDVLNACLTLASLE